MGVLQELRREVEDVARVLELERAHCRELEGEVERLTGLLDQEAEKN
jgi:hypothetical protein